MSLQPDAIGPVPDETQRVAHAAFPKDNVFMQMRDVLGPIYDDASFAPLFATRGRPAEAPWRLALVTVMQFAEGLSDRQAAEAVRARMDWKYALGLDLTDPGFDFSVLSECRTRLVEGAAEHLLFDQLLAACRERGYLKARGRQRTDSTHVLGSLRILSRLEQVAETLRAALNATAAVAPNWLRERTPAEWFERYGRRIEEYRLPKGKDARQDYVATVGRDGFQLLAACLVPTAPPEVRHLPGVELLRRTWIQQYVIHDEQVRLRDPKDTPSATEQVESSYEVEVRYGSKGTLSWAGYKVHLTETCDEGRPHLLTQLETTVAPTSDQASLGVIQADLARISFLPTEQLVDAGYVRGPNLVASRHDHQVNLVGPIPEDHQRQARAKQGFDGAHFAVDWDAQTVTCPQGRLSQRWRESRTARGRTLIFVQFAAADCTPCPVSAQCTHATTSPRSLTLQPRAEHEAIQAARHRQHIATAAAINVRRVVDWVNEVPRAATRHSHFAELAAA